MPDETIYYAFEGDSSRLQQATQQAIDSLTLYEDMVKNIQGVLNSLMSSLNDTVDYIRLLSDEIKQLVQLLSTSSDAFKNVKESSDSYANAMRSAALAQGQVQSEGDKTTDSLKQSGDEAQKSKSKWTLLTEAVQQLHKVLANLKSPTRETTNLLKELNSTVSDVATAIKTFIGIDLASTFEKSAISAMDYIENLNLFNVAMGDMIEQGKSFVSQMQEVYGLDPSNIMTYVGNFKQLASAVEMPAETATILSTNMTKMATDVASVFNMDVVKVIDNMKSGIMGMSRAVTKYGMDIRATTLQQTALSLGLTDNVRNMSEANREGLRYITMMRQASNLSGDWAKTIESPSNQLRILKEQLTQLARAIGNLFLPTLIKILPYINGFVMALREAVQAIADFFGFTQMDFGGTTSTIDKGSSAIENMGNEAEKTAKKLKSLKAPFDELNVIQETSSQDSDNGAISSEIMDPAIVAAINALNVPLETVRMKANEVRDALLEFFNLDGGNLEKILQKIKNLFQGIIDICKVLKAKAEDALSFNNNGATILSNIRGILSDIYNWFMRIIISTQQWASKLNLEPIVSSLANLSSALRTFLSMIGDTLESLYTNVIQPLGKKVIEEIIPAVINKIADILNYLGEHPEVADTLLAIAAAIGIVIGVIKGASAIISIVQTIATTCEGLSTAIGLVAAATGLASWQVWLIIAAIVAVIAVIVLVVTHLDEIKEWMQTNVPYLYQAIQLFGQVIKNTFQFIWDIIKTVLNWVWTTIKDVFGSIFKFVKNIFMDFIYFLNAIFAGDWKEAGKYLVNILIDVVQFAIDIIVDAVNFVLGLISGIINAVGSAANYIGKAFGQDWGWNVDIRIDKSKLQIPKLATGGVVSGPTQAMIGEGKYHEAVIPLGNSPQLEEMLDKFADKVNQQGPTEVRVYIGGDEWDAFTYKSSLRGANKLGAPILGGKTRA